MHIAIDTERRLSFVAIVNNSFVDFQICLTFNGADHTIAYIKGTDTIGFRDDSRIDPVDFLTILRRAFAFMRNIPPHAPVLYHLQQLYPEYFI